MAAILIEHRKNFSKPFEAKILREEYGLSKQETDRLIRYMNITGINFHEYIRKNKRGASLVKFFDLDDAIDACTFYESTCSREDGKKSARLLKKKILKIKERINE